MHPTKFPSNAAYDGKKLAADIEGYDEFHAWWTLVLKRLILSCNLDMIITHHNDVGKLFSIDATCLEPSRCLCLG
jgi:hypothetical protein